MIIKLSKYHQESISSQIESDRSAKDPEKIFGRYKKRNLILVINSLESRREKEHFFKASNRQNPLQSIH